MNKFNQTVQDPALYASTMAQKEITMNNEINKIHEEILFKEFKKEMSATFGSFKADYPTLLTVIYKAMAEVAGLRDKEVEKLSEHNEAWHNEHLRVCNELAELKDYLKNLKHRVNSHYGGGFTDEDIALAHYKRKSEEQEKEIEQLKAKANGTYLQSIAPQ